MDFKHSGRRTLLWAIDTFMNSWVKPLLWFTERFIVSQKKVNLFEIWVFRKLPLFWNVVKEEKHGVLGGSILSRLWKLKAGKYMLLNYTVTNRNDKMTNDFRSLASILGCFQVSLLCITCFILAFSLVLNIGELRTHDFWHYIVTILTRILVHENIARAGNQAKGARLIEIFGEFYFFFRK